jgi:tetratricopeptide (TPR) repeat protein
MERAEKSGNERVQLPVAQLLIEATLGAEDFMESWKLLTNTEPLAKSIDDGKHADYVLGQLGDLYKQLAEKCLDRSRRYFEEALQVSTRDEIGMRAVPHLAGIAAAWMRLGDMDAARLRYEQAYEISSESADPTRAAEVCGNLASLEYIVQHYDKALEWYDKAIKLSHLAGDERTEGIHLMNKANVFVKEKLYPAAFTCYKSARKLLAGDPLLSLLDYHETAAKRLSNESR